MNIKGEVKTKSSNFYYSYIFLKRKKISLMQYRGKVGLFRLTLFTKLQLLYILFWQEFIKEVDNPYLVELQNKILFAFQIY